MKQTQILIRYGEIGLKAEYTRRQFTRQLKNNLMYAFSQENISVKIEMMRGRFFIHTEEIERSMQVLRKIFGIVSFSSVWQTSSELNVIAKDAIDLMRSYLDHSLTFALRVRRSGNHEYTSQDAAIHVGKVIEDRYHASVDLDTPDVELFIEIRDEKAFFFLDKNKGVGGLPYSTQGKICCIVTDQKDILASWYLMKRGCSVKYIITKKEHKVMIQDFLGKWYIKQTPGMIIEEKNIFRDVEPVNLGKNCQAICMGISFDYETEALILRIKQYQTRFFLPVLTPLISMNTTEIDKMIEFVM